jgi:hypothetical protein
MKYTVKLYGKANVTAYTEVEASNAAEAIRVVHENKDGVMLDAVVWQYDDLDAIFEDISEAWPT